MIGIYKIISPSNRIYVGQSTNIEKRFIFYKKLKCKNQRLLYNSLQKYGIENHKFEIIEECSIEQLNKREIFWTKFYNAFVEDGGLVLKVGGKFGYDSKETKILKSISMKGKLLGRKNKGASEKNKGNKFSEKERSDSFKQKMREIKTGKKLSKEIKQKISNSLKGRKIDWIKHSQETKDKISRKNKGKNLKPIIQFDSQNNFIKEWLSITEASVTLNIKFNTISNNLLGYTRKGHGFIWKYKT